ncbi:MAG: hypothetical protein IKM38_07895 [Christensenellaceae bacterium]|nr:hypothetical protein [Christensenellaceae bacterium]
MNLDLFNYIEQTLEIYETKKNIYKLIAEEITEYFEDILVKDSGGELSIQYRIKSTESTREKIIRNNLAHIHDDPEDVLRNMRDLIGVRLECMFIQDEAKIYEKIRSIFTKTEDGIFYFDPFMPKIRLNIMERQPQKQKNGFGIYKLDGVFLLGREAVLFELQIKAMVNNFWGEIEHKIVYKNSAYVMADQYVTDLMISVKDGLNMIDSQLSVLYNQFKRTDDKKTNNVLSQMSMFLSKMVHDTFAELMMEQIGFVISFRPSCDTLISYLLAKNGGQTYENYGTTMLRVLRLLRSAKQEALRLDEKLEFDGCLASGDPFVNSIANTLSDFADQDFNWHLFCLILFCIGKDHTEKTKLEMLEDYAFYYKERILSSGAFTVLEQLDPYTCALVKQDLLLSVAQIIRSKQNIKYLCESGMTKISNMLQSFIPLILDNLGNGGDWIEIRESLLYELQSNIE